MQTLTGLDDACSPERREADFALNLDICEAVKSKISKYIITHIMSINLILIVPGWQRITSGSW